MSRTPSIVSLMLAESDPVFRAGLIRCLDRFPEFQVAIEAETTVAAWRILIEQSREIDVILVGIGLEFGRQIKAQFPNLPILLIEPLTERELMTAFQSGIEGYCPKGSSIAQFVAAIRQLSAGQPYWQPEILQQLTLSTAQPRSISVLAVVRQNWRSLGLSQIDAAINTINAQLKLPNLSLLDRVFLVGRRRELKAARWIVEQTLPAQRLSDDQQIILPNNASVLLNNADVTAAIVPVEATPLISEKPKDLQADLFDRIAAKLSSSLENLTAAPLEIDILKPERKRELFYIILRQLEQVLDELRFSQVQPDQLAAKQATILRDLWSAIVIQFFGKYSTVRLRNQDIEIVAAILEDGNIVQTQILDRIPLVQDALRSLLFQSSIVVEQTPRAVGSPEAQIRISEILENLIIQLANATIQPLLNRFSNLEPIKQGFYDRRLLSTREIERFRNDLSWRFRVERNFNEPKAVFESQHRLFVLGDYGIDRIRIYAPRSEELEDLSGIPLAITLLLETRDAISPRLRSTIAFFGRGIVYVLTEVIGRGIGLIGRGILKGIGKSVRG